MFHPPQNCCSLCSLLLQFSSSVTQTLTLGIQMLLCLCKILLSRCSSQGCFFWFVCLFQALLKRKNCLTLCHQETDVDRRSWGGLQAQRSFTLLSNAIQNSIINQNNNKEKDDITSWEFGGQDTNVLMKSAREISKGRNGISEPNSHLQAPKSTCVFEKPF